jgi:hypothetical protein
MSDIWITWKYNSCNECDIEIELELYDKTGIFINVHQDEQSALLECNKYKNKIRKKDIVRKNFRNINDNDGLKYAGSEDNLFHCARIKSTKSLDTLYFLLMHEDCESEGGMSWTLIYRSYNTMMKDIKQNLNVNHLHDEDFCIYNDEKECEKHFLKELKENNHGEIRSGKATMVYTIIKYNFLEKMM